MPFELNPKFRNDYNITQDGALQFSRQAVEDSIFNGRYAMQHSLSGQNTFVNFSASDGISEAYNVSEDGPIPTYKSTAKSAKILPHMVAVDEWASVMENYFSNGTFVLNRPSAMVNGTVRKVGTMAIFGYDESTDFDDSARSAGAVATEVADLGELASNISNIVSQGYTPVLASSMSKEDLQIQFLAGIEGQTDMLTSLYLAKLNSLEFIQIKKTEGVVLYAKELMGVASANSVILRQSNSAVQQTLTTSVDGTDQFGIDGKFANAWSQAKEALQAILIAGYTYLGDKTNTFKLAGTMEATESDSNGSSGDLYKPEDDEA